MPMCDAQQCCQHADGQQHVPAECSAEQIEQCHGTTGDHPCLSSECEKTDACCRKEEQR